MLMMTKLGSAIGLLLGGLLVMVPAADQEKASAKPTVVLGTFDSRAIATAWVRSAEFAKYVEGLRADVKSATQRAMAAGDRSLAAELDALGPAMQERIHEQGFGAAPVDEIVAHIAERLPAIAKTAGVDLIVSKWALSWRAAGAETVDVTDAMVAVFEPNAATLAVIRELVATEPQTAKQPRGSR